MAAEVEAKREAKAKAREERLKIETEPKAYRPYILEADGNAVNDQRRSNELSKAAANRSKRSSMNGSAFPPVSSIPGLGSLAVAASTPVVSSWMGSVGKKWEELQRNPSFSKNQRRASTLFSDVSNSFVSSVLGGGSQLSSSPPKLPVGTPSQSLLDDDEDEGGDAHCLLSPVMEPDETISSVFAKSTVPKPSPLSSSIGKGSDKPLEPDDEWNW